AHARKVAEPGNLVFAALIRMRDEAAHGDGLAVKRRYRSLHLLEVQGRADLAIAQAYRHRIHRGYLGINAQDDAAVERYARRDLENHAHLATVDIVADDAGRRDVTAGDNGDFLADVDVSGLIVQAHELRPAQNIHAILRLEGSDQHIDAVAGGGE